MKLHVKRVGEKKIAGVRLLKRMTTYSLYECKEIYETSNFLINISDDKDLFDLLIQHCDFEWTILDTTEKKRIDKFIELGIAEKETIITSLLDIDSILISNYDNNFDYMKSVYLLLDNSCVALVFYYKDRKYLLSLVWLAQEVHLELSANNYIRILE